MGPIVCATRGGESSRRTQEQAVALAKERDAELVFLAVFDPCCAGDVGEPLAEAVEKEQRWLGRALLGTAQVRARRRGVEPTAVVLCGPVLETIESYLLQVDASALILGEPKVDSALAAFHPSRVSHFAERVRLDTGVEVIVVTPDA
jgi:nucleotide-binding universal stress UspA family protein